jgi:mono/diheme cytochrome c family protein
MLALLLAACGPTIGCQRAVSPQFASAEAMSQLDPEMQSAVQMELTKWCGTPSDLKLIGGDPKEDERLKRGGEIYRRYCQQCHGVSGDGEGLAAAYLTPRPRDYRRGIFKFTSTPYGAKPRREDLLRTIERGVVGTSMPSFRLMPKRDLDAVLDYVLALTHRGELEQQLIVQAEADGELTDEAVDELVQSIVERWNTARDNVVEPASKMPAMTAESVAAGAAIFQKRECFKCHGRDGRGGLAGGIEVGNDAWGRKDPAADLTSGMLHGGQAPLDIYRRISSGINGTPMPAFKDSFTNEPDAIWQLTHYVLSLANQRRRGVQYPKTIAAATDSQPAAGKSDSRQDPAENTP